MNTTTQYTASTTAAKFAFAALALATVASFATAMKASEQGAVTSAKASQLQAVKTLEVRVAAPVIVTAKRDIRRLEAIEVVGHRSEIVVASAGGLRNSTSKFTATAAR
jgi:hypothetical protein